MRPATADDGGLGDGLLLDVFGDREHHPQQLADPSRPKATRTGGYLPGPLARAPVGVTLHVSLQLWGLRPSTS